MHCPKGRVAENLAATERYIKEAVANKANVVVFPEMSITGYIDPSKTPEAVLTLESRAVQEFCAMTKDSNVLALGGIVESNLSGKPFITQVVAGDGRLQGYYRKVNVAPDEVKWFDPAKDTPIFNYDDIPYGVAICADVGHGDLFARYSKQGAEVVFASAAPGLYGPQETRNWQSGFEWWRGECKKNLSEFAKDDNLCIAVATQAGRTVDEDFPGGGYVFDATGTLVAETPDWHESVLYAQIDV